MIAALVVKIPGVKQVVSQKKTPLVDLMQTLTRSDGDSNNNDK